MRSQLIQSSPVLDQRLDQIDQQGEEATGSCGLWIEREEGEAQLTRVGGERGSEQPLTAPVVELHRRQVLAHAGHFVPLCSCGWMGLGLLTEGIALLVPCEVELLLAESQLRRRRLIQAAG